MKSTIERTTTGMQYVIPGAERIVSWASSTRTCSKMRFDLELNSLDLK